MVGGVVYVLVSGMMSLQGAGVDFVGDMTVVLLLSGHNENKLENLRRSCGGGSNETGQQRANRKGHS